MSHAAGRGFRSSSAVSKSRAKQKKGGNASGPLPAAAVTRAARFAAALRSRSTTAPQCSHRKTRSDRTSVAFAVPHAEQSLLLGKNVSASISFDPYHWHL